METVSTIIAGISVQPSNWQARSRRSPHINRPSGRNADRLKEHSEARDPSGESLDVAEIATMAFADDDVIDGERLGGCGRHGEIPKKMGVGPKVDAPSWSEAVLPVANADQKIGRRLYRLSVPVDHVVAAQGPSEQIVVHEIEVADGGAYRVADEDVRIALAVSGFAAFAAAGSQPDPLADDVARDLKDQAGLLD
jgi:hypothetical protein